MGLSEKLVMSSIEVYKTVCASLLPTPSKSHYTFNLRDLSKIFQGVLMMESKKVDVNQLRSVLFLYSLSLSLYRFYELFRVSNVFFVYGIMKIVESFKIV